jgi:hypothetical protein
MPHPALVEIASAPLQRRNVLFSAMKNEAPFVLEWIAYHKVIGFDEIAICSNPSNDGMEEILTALAEAGEITHLRVTVPTNRSPQVTASRAYTSQVGYREGDWYIWLDADEFLNVHVGDRTVSALAAALGDRQIALVNWRVFGSSGQREFSGRVLSPQFVGASRPGFASNLEVKSFFRFSAAVRGFGQQCLNRPLIANPSLLGPVAMGNGTNAEITRWKNQAWLTGADVRGTARVRPEEFGWSFAQINHYMVRTPEFFALKRVRGRGYKANATGEANTRHTDAFFTDHDRNEDEDRSILHWEQAVTQEIARLLRIPAVAAAKHRSEALVRKLLADLNGLQDVSAPAPSAPQFENLPSEAATSEAQPAEGSSVSPPAPAPEFRLTFPRREANLVRQSYAKASVILEYGSGGSTLLAAELGKKIISVESDKAWAERLSARLTPFPGAAVHHVYVGPTLKWGMPSRPRFHGRFHQYALSVWDRPDLGDPDLVLIDGRFRAACLAAVMLRARRPTTVLFDDYSDRPHYHGVEKLACKEETVGRMARFTVTPGVIPPEQLTEAIGWFSDPR